jgi:hypothetical protein
MNGCQVIEQACLYGSGMLSSQTVDKTWREHLVRAARKRWKGKTDAEKSAVAQHASRAFWDSLSPEQRSAEMKRRAMKRKKKK